MLNLRFILTSGSSRPVALASICSLVTSPTNTLTSVLSLKSRGSPWFLAKVVTRVFCLVGWVSFLFSSLLLFFSFLRHKWELWLHIWCQLSDNALQWWDSTFFQFPKVETYISDFRSLSPSSFFFLTFLMCLSQNLQNTFTTSLNPLSNNISLQRQCKYIITKYSQFLLIPYNFAVIYFWNP